MTDYTPGPWKLCAHLASPEGDRNCKCGYRGGIWGADGEHVVCEIGPAVIEGQEGLEGGHYPRPVELANARLIAAAPDLLGACEAMLDGFYRDTLNLDRAMKMARSAISKATGVK